MRDNPKTKPNHIFAIVCIAIVFFVIGLIGLVLIHSNNFLRLLENNLVAMVELDDNLEVSEIEALQTILNSNSFIDNGSVQYITKEDALNIMQKELGDDIAIPGENPFFNAYSFKIKAKYRNQSDLEKLRSALTGTSGITNFHYPKRIADQFAGFIRTFIQVSFCIVLLFLFLGIYLIINTIKLSLYANRFLIKNMQIVGAPWQFIRGPFIRSGLINGLISSTISIGLIIVIILFSVSYSTQIDQIFDISLTALLLFSLLVACLLTCWVSTKFGVDFYLKQKLERLY